MRYKLFKTLSCFTMAAVIAATSISPALASSGTVDQEAWEGSRVVAKQIEAEGIVLLENDSALPFAEGTRVNVFGTGSLDPFLGGGGSGAIRVDDPENLIDFYEGLENAGISYNESLREQYQAWYDENYEDPSFAGEGGALGQFGSRATLAEMPVSEITDAQIAEYKEYSETAIVVISRCGTESADLSAGTLKLSEIEDAMVKKVATEFENVVVLFNIDNIMEMGFLEDKDNYPNIKAAAIIWAPGEVGMDSVGKMLSGEVNPSGKLADTVAYHIEDHPSNENFGQYLYDGDNVDPNRRNDAFVEYEEGIYVGYRYFETFAQDKVQYPFGYGLSYTDFAWDVASITVEEDTVTAVVEVTNTGDVAGKDVVQVYYSAPYTNGGVEKSAVELVAFAKTNELKPNESQTLTVTYDVKDMASYDMEAEAWVLDAGAYDIRVCHDVRTIAGNSTWNLAERRVMDKDNKTGGQIENRFDYADYGLTILSRSNEEATYPTAPVSITEPEPRYAAPENVDFSVYEKLPQVDITSKGPDTGVEYEDGTVMLRDVYIAGYKDDLYHSPLWDKFLDQFTVDEMIEMNYRGGFRTVGIDRLGVPATVDNDGPAAIKGPGEGSYDDSGIAYPVDTVLACTWNVDLAVAKGEAIAVEGEAIGTNVWYAPGINIHRSPRGGRNFEYYSEDPLLCGRLAANLVKGAQSKGVIPTIKHFAVNEQEQGRESLYTWLNEQSLREIYLKPFEIAVKEGEAHGVMSSFNRIGPVWAGANKELLTDVLRNEWGFEGFVVTDYLQNYSGAMENYFGIAISAYAGNDTILEPSWADGFTYRTVLAGMQACYEADPAGMGTALRNLTKNLCYMKMHTLAFQNDPNVKPFIELNEKLDAANKELDDTKKELEDTNKELDAANQEIADKTQELEEANEAVEKAEADKEKAEQDVQEAQKELDAANEAVDQAKKDLEEANADRDEAQKALDQAITARDEAQKALDQANADRDEAQKELDQANANRDEAQKALDQANADKNAIQAALDQANTALKKAQDDYRALQTQTSQTSQITVGKVALNKLTSKKKKQMQISWKAVAGVSGYEIQYARKKNMKNAITQTVGAKKLKVTIKKLTSKKKYFVRVRAYTNSGSGAVYGAYSNVKKVKVK